MNKLTKLDSITVIRKPTSDRNYQIRNMLTMN